MEQAADGSLLHGVYVIWDSPVKPWVLTTDTETLSCGEYGYLHEYVAFETPTMQAEIEIPEDGMWVDGLRNYPVSAEFTDKYAESLEQAERIKKGKVTMFLIGAVFMGLAGDVVGYKIKR